MRTIKSILTQLDYSIFRILEEVGVFEYKETLDTEHISTLLFHDLLRFVENDPAAKCCGYVLESYECFKAITYYRVANALHYNQASSVSEKKFLKMKARKISEISKSKTGIEIHPAAKIDRGFVIDHGYGTVIGETVVIGKNCYLLQGVILGARGIANNQDKIRHPKIGDNVQIGAFTKILGNVKVGDNVFIGPNSIVIEDIEDGKKIKNLNQIQISQNKNSKILINDLKKVANTIVVYGDHLHLVKSIIIFSTYNEKTEKIECELTLISDYELELKPLVLIPEHLDTIEMEMQCDRENIILVKNFKIFTGALKNAS